MTERGAEQTAAEITHEAAKRKKVTKEVRSRGARKKSKTTKQNLRTSLESVFAESHMTATCFAPCYWYAVCLTYYRPVTPEKTCSTMVEGHSSVPYSLFLHGLVLFYLQRVT